MLKNGMYTKVVGRKNRSRTQRHIRQEYGSNVPLPQYSSFRTLRTIIYFAVFGLIILGTLYWLFG
jgi:hypothetical protein